MARKGDARRDRPQLRQMARDAAQGKVPDLAQLSAEDLATLVREFGVYQLELEAQNEELRQSRHDLEEARDKYAELYDSAPVGFVTLSPEGLIREINLTLCDMLGRPRTELLGRPFSAFVQEQSLTALHKHIRGTVAGRPAMAEVVLATPGGERNFRLRSAAVADGEGKATLRTAVTDISRLKEQERRILRESVVNRAMAGVAGTLIAAASSLEAIASAVLECGLAVTGSAHGYVGSIDPASGDLVMHTFTDMMRRGSCRVPHTDIRFPWGHSGYAGLWGHALNTLGVFHTNSPSRHPSARGLPEGHVPIERFLSVPALYEGRLVGQIALANPGRDYGEDDIAAAKTLADLFALAVHGARSRMELQAAKEAAEAASTAKSLFLANMSHELRSPLNGVLGMLQLLELSGIDQEQKEYVQTGLDSGRRLLKLLADILDLAKIEAGKLEVVEGPFNAAALVRDLLGAQRRQAREKGLELRWTIDGNIPETLVGDAGRIGQVLLNIVGNAVKFTPQGEIAVEVLALPRQGRCRNLFFSVLDTGVGIPEDKLDVIFEPFTQVDDSHTRRFGGAGLGLAIVRRLLESLGGYIQVEGLPGQGTAFHFAVPVHPAEDRAGERPAPRAKGRTAKARASARLLVVEDETETRAMLIRMLGKLGFDAVGVSDGQEALALLAGEGFDGVLMDIQLPGMSGVTAAKAIRNAKFPAIDRSMPIVAVTAYAMKGDRERFLAAGMDDYVAKPVDMEDLRSALARAGVRGAKG